MDDKEKSNIDEESTLLDDALENEETIDDNENNDDLKIAETLDENNETVKNINDIDNVNQDLDFAEDKINDELAKEKSEIKVGEDENKTEDIDNELNNDESLNVDSVENIQTSFNEDEVTDGLNKDLTDIKDNDEENPLDINDEERPLDINDEEKPSDINDEENPLDINDEEKPSDINDEENPLDINDEENPLDINDEKMENGNNKTPLYQFQENLTNENDNSKDEQINEIKSLEEHNNINSSKLDSTQLETDNQSNNNNAVDNNDINKSMVEEINISHENNSNLDNKDNNSEKSDNEIEYDRLPKINANLKHTSALTPVFSFGFNKYVPIINLSRDNKYFIFYSCSHLGVIYDYIHNEQLLLQGHCNSISCITTSADKRWLATGDMGENSVVIIWDSNSGLPVRTMFEPHINGVRAIALSPCARYLATLSAEHTQTFSIWDWTTGEDTALCSASLSPNYGVQNFIDFSIDDPCHVTTNSDCQVLFYHWKKTGDLKYFAPELTEKDFHKAVGKFSNTKFIPKTTKALTGTSLGLIVIWDSNLPLAKAPTENTPNKKAIKLVPIHDCAITCLTIIDDLIVTGDVEGTIKYFDFDYKILYWYQGWKFGPITSVSPTNVKPFQESKSLVEKSNYPYDATIQRTKFVTRDFIVGTSTTIFATVGVESTKIKIIFKDHDSSVFTAHEHPTLPLFATASYSGLLRIWSYETRESIVSRVFEKDSIKSICFDHRGVQLAVGFVNGTLRILDTHALKDVCEPFTYSKTYITIIRFSEDSKYLATVDGGFTTTLYQSFPEKNGFEWHYVARFRAHYKRIVDAMFGRYFDTHTARLFTLGEDRRLVEYDLYNATKDNLPIISETRVEQSAIPFSMCWYPEDGGEGFIVTSNDEYKLKMFNHQTKMCRYTYLGPTFGSPVKILRRLPKNETHADLPQGQKQRYIAYSNEDKVGLIKLPLDGNPYNYMVMIAHPRGVTNIATSFDGKYIATVGSDFIVTIWEIDVKILDEKANSIEDEMTPYYELIEGGEFGPFMNDMKNYFYYSMIRLQGIDSIDTRKVDVVIDITEIPFIMRAIGFYPTEEEIEDMMNELKFKNYYITGEKETKVDLNTFIKLYLNHRPAFGISFDKIKEAFDVIEIFEGKALTLERFITLLINRGEPIAEEDLIEYFATLLGFNKIGGSLEQEEFHAQSVITDVNNSLPETINAASFVTKILNMEISEDAETKTLKYRRHIDGNIRFSTNGSQTE